MSLATGSHSALAAATCTMGTASGTTTTINLNGTTCTAPFVPGYTTTNVTNNPQTPTAATQPGTLYQDASALANLNGATSFTIGGTISDGTGPTSVYLNLPNFTLISNIVSTYSGTTTIAGGTLMLGGAGVLSATSIHSVLTGGILDLGGTTQTLNNALQLQGGTVQNGAISGSVTSAGGTISGVTFSGALTTTAGTTTISNFGFTNIIIGAGSAVTTSSTNEQNGGTVGGAGTFNGAVNLNGGGILAPFAGSGPGTLTVNGNVAFASGSIFSIIATPTAASQLAVNGATTINGASVAVNALTGTYSPATTYTILTSTKGVSGTFTGASFTNGGSAFMNPTLSYDANDAYLTLTRNGTTVQSMATTNTSSEAGVINAAPNTALGRAFLMLPANQVQNALNSVSGEANTQVQTAGTQATRAFTNFISDRATPSGAGGQGSVEVTTGAGLPAGALGYVALNSRESPIVVDKPKPAQGLRIFATGFGGGSSLQGQNGDVAGQTGSYYGGLMGVDYRVTPDLLIGAAAGGSSSNFLVAARSSSGSVTGFNGNVFAIASAGAFYGQTLTTFSAFSNSTARSVAGFGGLASALEKASFGSHEVRERLEFGRVVDVAEKTGVKGFKITPFVAMEIARLDASGYSETNASGGANVFGLTASGKTFDDARTFLGARLEASYDIGKGMILRPIVRLAWVHAFTTAPNSTNTFQNIPGTSFVITGATVARDAAETKVGAELAIGKSTVLFANFDGEFANIQQVYGGRAGFRFSF